MSRRLTKFEGKADVGQILKVKRSGEDCFRVVKALQPVKCDSEERIVKKKVDVSKLLKDVDKTLAETEALKTELVGKKRAQAPVKGAKAKAPSKEFVSKGKPKPDEPVKKSDLPRPVPGGKKAQTAIRPPPIKGALRDIEPRPSGIGEAKVVNQIPGFTSLETTLVRSGTRPNIENLLNRKTVPDLRKIASRQNLSGIRNAKKPQLVKMITNNTLILR